MHLEEKLKNKINSDYWKKKLKDEISDSLTAPFTRSLLTKPQEKEPVELTVPLPGAVTAEIARICSNSDVLVFTFHLAALKALLFRYTKAEKLVIASSPFLIIEKEPYKEELFAFYKTEMQKDLSFKELFAKVKEEVLTTNNYHEVLMEDLVEYTGGENIENLMQAGFAIEGVNQDPAPDKFELLLKISTTHEGRQLSAFFDANALDTRLVQFFLDNYCTFLQNILEGLYDLISEIDFLSASEKKLLLQDFGGPEKTLAFPTAIHRFEHQVKQVPHAIAVEFNGKKRSYDDLNAGANQFARVLLGKISLKTDDLVAIIMDRSDKMVETILAVWKCGAAYVPVDPEYPADRIKAILENAAVRLIIGESGSLDNGLKEVLTPFAEVISTDETDRLKISCEKENLDIAVDPNALAYVIYTSGSTGKPKGVMIEHVGMMNHLEAKFTEMEIGPQSIVVQNAPQCFDISVWQFFAALMVGGKTIVYDNDVVLNLEEFINRIEQDKVTTLELVPSYLLEMQYILDELKDESLFSKLNILILNAETLMPSAVQRWFASFPNIRIVNTYGATEVSDDMSHYIMDKLPETATVPVMYRPIQNFNLYILDEEMQLCPIGVKGEIYLSGFAVGRGYLNDAEKTQAAFLTDSFVKNKSVRMYKTGDLGRLLADGTMEFYGRQDFQVKIRGHRVELGEIEHQLTHLEGIKNAVVLDREYEDGQKYLAAYIVAENKIDPATIAAKLRSQLPDYMVPSFFIRMDRFPLTANGKINKKNLPDPQSPDRTQTPDPVPFSNRIEEKLTQIWEEVLDKKNIGSTDNFFEIGGHSLKATKLVYKIHRELEIKLDLRVVFTHPTIEEQARIISKEQVTKFKEIEPLPVQDHYELSHAQKRLWILSQLENTSIAYNMHGAFLFEGNLNRNALENAFRELVKRHESLRTVFITKDGEPRQKILSTAEVNFRLAFTDLSQKPDRDILAENLASDEAVIPFDLTTGPLLRAGLIKLEECRYVFLFTMHHIIGDGWSMGVLLNETLKLYNDLNKNIPGTLAPLRIQYRDYAAWQNAQLAGDLLAKNQQYWMSRFEDEVPVLELPYDKPRPRVQTFNGNMVDFLLDKTLVEKLNSLSKEKDVTFFVSLLAAVKILFYKYTGQTDIVVGSPIAGREHSDLENQIGFYVNTLALRTRFSPENSYEQLLAIIKEESINAYEHQLYPFDRLVDDLNLQKDLSRSALFDVMVALQNTELDNSKPIAIDGITVSGFSSKRMVSMFDLTISFSEAGESYLVSMEYNTDLFHQHTIVRLGEHFSALLAELVHAPAKPVREVSYISKEEENKLLIGNDSLVPSSGKTVLQLFEEQVTKNPGKAAVSYDGTSLTYHDLNLKATELAAYLAKNHSVKNQDIIAIHLQRSTEAVVAILAVLKLNAVFLPVDVNTPAERLAYVLQDSKAKLLITATEYEGLDIPIHLGKISYDEAFPPPSGSGHEAIAGAYPPLAGAGGGLQQSLIGDPQSSAYIIYTSGTTGNPKGVNISHAALANYVNWFTRTYHITEQDKTLLISSLGFDLGYTGFWSSLVSGSTLHIMAETKQPDASVLMYHLAQHGITYIKLTPSHFKILVNELKSTEMKLQLRLIVMGGEPVQAEDVERYFEYDKNVTIVNHYGPTETTIGAIAATVNYDDFKTFKANPHIGKPIDNTRVYLLDNDGKPVPRGIRGEICIAGSGLATGYHNQPELTAEKFATIDVGGKTERVYKTSDLGKLAEDGNIVLLGRKDNQVKIRGYRIEPEEIAYTLKKNSEIEEAVVITEEQHGDRQLVAFVVPKPAASPFISGFKRYKLPNNLAVAQINKNETDYIYKEIFELQAYIKYGLSLKDGDCIFDVGANIGLFSIFAQVACKNPKVYAFEPNLHVYEVLNANAALYCPGIRLFRCGLAEERKVSEFTFFEGFSLLSGLYTDEKVERDMVKTFMTNQQNKGMEDMKELVSSADQILSERFNASKFSVQLEPLSDIIERENVQQIDYLKINVEKAELDVLKGIRDEHWPRIRQIVLEVDVKENLPVIISLLEKQGYDFFVEQDTLLEGTSLCYIYAIRKGDVNRLNRAEKQQKVQLPVFEDKIISDTAIRDFIRTKLPDYMMPSRIIPVEKIPLTPNGKVNKKALARLSAEIDNQAEYVAPGNEVEQKLSVIWQNILGREKIGIQDNFFEIGGNSLKVVELFRQIDMNYPGTMNVTTLFDNTTISKQAGFINSKTLASKPAGTEVIEEIEL